VPARAGASASSPALICEAPAGSRPSAERIAGWGERPAGSSRAGSAEGRYLAGAGRLAYLEVSSLRDRQAAAVGRTLEARRPAERAESAAAKRRRLSSVLRTLRAAWERRRSAAAEARLDRICARNEKAGGQLQQDFIDFLLKTEALRPGTAAGRSDAGDLASENAGLAQHHLVPTAVRGLGERVRDSGVEAVADIGDDEPDHRAPSPRASCGRRGWRCSRVSQLPD
jgi:hypothetical protein